MINFIANNINILDECTSVLGTEFYNILQEIFTIIKIAVPVLVLVLCSVDMSKAVIAQDEKAVKEALSSSIKRLIIGVVVFFIPIIINLLLKYAGLVSGTCGIS